MLSAVFSNPIPQGFFNRLFHGSIEFAAFGDNCPFELLEQFSIQEDGEAFFLHVNRVNGSMKVFIRRSRCDKW